MMEDIWFGCQIISPDNISDLVYRFLLRVIIWGDPGPGSLQMIISNLFLERESHSILNCALYFNQKDVAASGHS